MVFKNKKQGQAAIEFLMTYGWMLLVVLIVGALIFSFVDFGSLLPNKMDLGNNLRGDAGSSVAYSNEATNAANMNEVKVVFSYVGAKQATIAYNSGTITNSLGNTCLSYGIENRDTGGSAGCNNNLAADCDAAAATAALGSTPVPFLNGQTGVITFICDSSAAAPALGPTAVGGVGPTAGNLLLSDVLEGTIAISVNNPKTGLDIVSSGPIRLSITQ